MKRLAISLLVALAAAAHAADKPQPTGTRPSAPSPSSMAPLPVSDVSLETCSTLLGDIERGEKEIALVRAGGFMDDSAPRESARGLEKLFHQEVQSQNLTMMIALRCPKLPVGRLRSGARYYMVALECHEVSRKGDSAKTKEACDRDRWVAKD